MLTAISFTLCYAATGSQGFSSSSNPEGSLLSWSSDRIPANCFALLNSSTFGGSPNSCGPLVAGFQALLIELSTPTTFVEIAGGWNSDYLELRAFDETSIMLALPQTLTTDPRVAGYSTTGTVSMASPTGSLKYVFAGSTEGGIALDRLSIAQVPEPSTLLLTMAGLVGLRGAPSPTYAFEVARSARVPTTCRGSQASVVSHPLTASFELHAKFASLFRSVADAVQFR